MPILAPQTPPVGHLTPAALLELLASVADGKVPVEEAAGSLSAIFASSGDGCGLGEGVSGSGQNPSESARDPLALPDDPSGILGKVASIAGATVDLGRQARCGFGEVVYGEGKSTELIIQIVQTQLAAGQTCLVTRIDPTSATQVRRHFPHTHHNPHARTLRIAERSESLTSPLLDNDSAHVAVVTAGSTDAAVAEEAVETLAWMGIAHRRMVDIGVAGPQRLLAAVPELRKASAIVVIAGMEGALPPTVAGHVAVPVIAVPTSMGYGANFAGLTPLMGMLTACAPNIAVVNIDAGFKGAYLAGLIAAGLNAQRKRLTSASIE